MSMQITHIVDFMKELSEDSVLPRNVKQKIDFIIEILSDDCDVSMRISKAMHELEDLVDDKNLQSYSRTQLYNVISQLESI